MSDFASWLDKYRSEISLIQGLLAEPLEDNPVAMSQQLKKIERWYGRLTFLTANANAYLDGAENQAWQELPESKLTSEAKKAMIAAKVKDERKARDILNGLCHAIDRRVSLGQSLLRIAEKEARSPR